MFQGLLEVLIDSLIVTYRLRHRESKNPPGTPIFKKSLQSRLDDPVYKKNLQMLIERNRKFEEARE